jgi:hypothetical protein
MKKKTAKTIGPVFKWPAPAREWLTANASEVNNLLRSHHKITPDQTWEALDPKRSGRILEHFEAFKKKVTPCVWPPQKKPEQLTAKEKRELARYERDHPPEPFPAHLDFMCHFGDATAHAEKTFFGGSETETAELNKEVTDFLVDYHRKVFDLPETGGFDETAPASNTLLFSLMVSVVKGDHTALRRIADAVERVHARATGEGETFGVGPVDEVRARVLVHVVKHGPPKSLAETKKLMLAAGFLYANLDPKTVQRWHKDLGGASGKPGRPSKKSGQTPAKRRPN